MHLLLIRYFIIYTWQGIKMNGHHITVCGFICWLSVGVTHMCVTKLTTICSDNVLSLDGAKRLSESVLKYCWLGPWEQTLVYLHISTGNSGHFVLTSMCLTNIHANKMGADGNTTTETNGDVKHCYHKKLTDLKINLYFPWILQHGLINSNYKYVRIYVIMK